MARARLRAELARVWSGDITCIATDAGGLYLAAVIDLLSRQVVGWRMQPHMQTSLVTDVLRLAWLRRRPEPGRIFHSDRCSQYGSHHVQAALKGDGTRSALSRKGNGWESRRRSDAPTQSLWDSLKVGPLCGKWFATHREAMDEVIDWLTFYNHRQSHSSLGDVSPMKFKANWRAGQRNKVASPRGDGRRRTGARAQASTIVDVLAAEESPETVAHRNPADA